MVKSTFLFAPLRSAAGFNPASFSRTRSENKKEKTGRKTCIYKFFDLSAFLANAPDYPQPF
jgi:hypothetical protein